MRPEPVRHLGVSYRVANEYLALATLAALACAPAEPSGRANLQEADSLLRVSKIRVADSLRRVIDEVRNSPAFLIEQAREAIAGGRPIEARAIAQNLLNQYPDDPHASEARKLIAKVDAVEKAAESARSAALERALAAMVKTRDEMRNLSFWRDRAAPRFVNSRSWLGAYIMQLDGGGTYLRMQINYLGSDWLFIKSYMFKVDGVDFRFDPESYGSDAVERDNGSGEIWEWWDVIAEGERMRFLQAVADAKTVTMRYNGSQYYRDRNIGPEERASLRRTLLAYQKLSGQ